MLTAAAAAAAVLHISVLTSLNLSRNKIGVEGGKAIAEAVRVNGVLTDLKNLSGNSIGGFLPQ